MSLHALAQGSLVSDPVSRTSNNGGTFATGSLRVATEGGESILCSVIAFGSPADELLRHRQGSTLAVSGRASLRSWTGKDGGEKHGLSLVVEQCASASAARRQERERRASSWRRR